MLKKKSVPTRPMTSELDTICGSVRSCPEMMVLQSALTPEKRVIADDANRN